MDYLLILGIFTIGAGAGALGIFLQQRSIRARFYKEIKDQLEQALFARRRRL
jgi:tRNA1(Val) A37 N6-methylase TrmN6